LNIARFSLGRARAPGLAGVFYGGRLEIVENDRSRITKLRLSVPETAPAAD
jgi:hypothetical protein